MRYGSPCTPRLSCVAALLIAVTSVPARTAPLYEAVVTITNPSSTVLVNHQVSLTIDTASLIGAGKLQADGDDLRITDANGSSLCFFLEGPLNTAQTIVWVRVPNLPAGDQVELLLYYGDPSATGVSDPACTFDYWEGFDDSTTDFGVACGSVIWSVSGGSLFLTWTGKGMFVASPAMALTPTLVAEADVTSATGTWPGLHWFLDGTQYSYALTYGNSAARISATPASTTDGDRCAAHAWASTVVSAGTVAGIWGLAWPATGAQRAAFPELAPLTAASAELARNRPLQLALGGIATGDGTLSVNWIRTRRYAAAPPTAAIGAEHEACRITPALCDDANPCTADICSVTGCTHSAITCSDGTVCTTDRCDTSLGCVFTPIDCADSSACTIDSCHPLNGCQYRATDCNDRNACTDDGCEPATGCTHTPIECDDHDQCTIDGCSVVVGCQYAAVDCSDGDACTLDSCDPMTGCAYQTRVCDDESLCTTNGCTPATGCVFTPVVCDDDNLCTDESCDADTGCAHTTISCDDHDACTIESCEPATGCAHATRDCDDADACSDDSCDPASGCQHVEHSCDDADACTTDACDPATGCRHTPIACDDEDPCTADTCDPTAGCMYPARTCDDGDTCTSDTCEPGRGCVFARLACDDHDVCSDDACTSPGGCTHEPTRGSSFPSIACQLDRLREQVRTARATPELANWFGRRVDKARLQFNRSWLAATSGAPRTARRGLLAVRALLTGFVARADGLRQRGRLRGPEAAELQTRGSTTLTNVKTLLTGL
jgi:Domain of unknown function (DUF2341)/Dictyostelium (slime mold) repeat